MWPTLTGSPRSRRSLVKLGASPSLTNSASRPGISVVRTENSSTEVYVITQFYNPLEYMRTVDHENLKISKNIHKILTRPPIHSKPTKANLFKHSMRNGGYERRNDLIQRENNKIMKRISNV